MTIRRATDAVAGERQPVPPSHSAPLAGPVIHRGDPRVATETARCPMGPHPSGGAGHMTAVVPSHTMRAIAARYPYVTLDQISGDEPCPVRRTWQAINPDAFHAHLYGAFDEVPHYTAKPSVDGYPSEVTEPYYRAVRDALGLVLAPLTVQLTQAFQRHDAESWAGAPVRGNHTITRDDVTISHLDGYPMTFVNRSWHGTYGERLSRGLVETNRRTLAIAEGLCEPLYVPRFLEAFLARHSFRTELELIVGDGATTSCSQVIDMLLKALPEPHGLTLEQALDQIDQKLLMLRLAQRCSFGFIGPISESKRPGGTIDAHGEVDVHPGIWEDVAFSKAWNPRTALEGTGTKYGCPLAASVLQIDKNGVPSIVASPLTETTRQYLRLLRLTLAA